MQKGISRNNLSKALNSELDTIRSNGCITCENYSYLSHINASIAYCKASYIDDNDVIYDAGLYYYDKTSSTWNIIDDYKDYLNSIIDDTTISMEDDTLVVKSLDGLQSSIDELNYIQGLNENIMDKLNSLLNIPHEGEMEQICLSPVVSGESYDIQSSNDISECKVYIQCFKSKENNNIASTISPNYINSDAFYCSDNIIFDDTSCYIRNKHVIQSTNIDSVYRYDIDKTKFHSSISLSSNTSSPISDQISIECSSHCVTPQCDYVPENAFDNDNNTTWLCAENESNPWISVQYGTKHLINTIGIIAPDIFNTLNGLEQSVRNCRIEYLDDSGYWQTILSINDEVYESGIEKIFKFDNTIETTSLRIYKQDNILQYMGIAQWNVYLLESCIIEMNGSYYAIDNTNHSLIELDSIDFSYKNTIKDIDNHLDLLSDTFTIISNIDMDVYVNGIQDTTELLVQHIPLSSNITHEIKRVRTISTLSGNSKLTCIFSTDNGNTWYTYTNGNINEVDISVPMNNYHNLSAYELLTWNNAKSNILSYGIPINVLDSIDFSNVSDIENIIFTYSLYNESIEDTCRLQSTQLLYNTSISYQSITDEDADINLNGNTVTITSHIDCDEIKVNILPNTIIQSRIIELEESNTKLQSNIDSLTERISALQESSAEIISRLDSL